MGFEISRENSRGGVGFENIGPTPMARRRAGGARAPVAPGAGGARPPVAPLLYQSRGGAKTLAGGARPPWPPRTLRA